MQKPKLIIILVCALVILTVGVWLVFRASYSTAYPGADEGPVVTGSIGVARGPAIRHSTSLPDKGTPPFNISR